MDLEKNRGINKIMETLFPERSITRKIPLYKQLLLCIVLYCFFYIGSNVIFADNYRGFDWVFFWGINHVPPFYPPWTSLVIYLLNWHSLVSITLTAILLAVLLRATHLISASLVFFTLPLFWTIFLGQLEGLSVLGILWLPWLAPLALIKPQISFFAFGAKKIYLIGLVIFLLISILIWGLWPIQTLSTNSFYTEGRSEKDISIGLYGIFIAIPLLWLSRGDIDMLMVAGAFFTTHLIPYNLLPVIPSIARLKPFPALIAVLLSWLPFSAIWLGPKGWWLGWLFIIWLWTALAFDRYPEIKKSILLKRAKLQV